MDFHVTLQRFAAERVPPVPQRMTVYLSKDDRAIGMSAWLFDSARRLGQLLGSDLSIQQSTALRGNVTVNLIDVRVKTDYMGHGYFISNPSVLSDMILLLRDNRPPGADHGRPLVQNDEGLWELREGYGLSEATP